MRGGRERQVYNTIAHTLAILALVQRLLLSLLLGLPATRFRGMASPAGAGPATSTARCRRIACLSTDWTLAWSALDEDSDE